ncbi:unnamed protein product [Withania somnifera]
MKTSLKTRYEPDKATATAAAAATVAFNAGDFKLRASMTDATVVKGPSLNGLGLIVEKPGSFIIDYNVPKKFMNSIRVLEKPLNLNYIHCHGDNRTILDGILVFDSTNKVSANHMMGSGSCKLKYTYVHGGITTFEPVFDTEKNAWDFMVSRKVYGDDVFRATYQTTTRNLGLEWSRSSKLNGSFKICASLSLLEERKMPKLSAETSWDFEM